jgi:coenzyme F420-reducing hydrogenase beta subunit
LDLQPVIDEDLCIGCGACVAADPSIDLELDSVSQVFRPSHAGNQDAASICPSVQVDYSGLNEWLFPGAEVSDLGVIDHVFLAQSTNRERNLRASSGGLIKELLHDLLARDDVDGIVSLERIEGIEYGAAMQTASEEIDRLPGSIYHCLDFQDALRLIRENEGRFVLVAIPCQLEGIYQYIKKFEPALRKRIHTTIGLICGWQYTRHALRAICQLTGVAYDDLSDVSYRGGGPVGPLVLRTPRGDTQVHRRIDPRYQAAFDRSYNIPRCHYCINHGNFFADIVVGDAWLPSTIKTRTGISIVVTRRKSGSEMLAALRDAGKLRLIDARLDDLVESQTHRVAYGDFAYPLMARAREKGHFVPELVGPNHAGHTPSGAESVDEFLATNAHKRRMHALRKYRRLFVRKLSVEIKPYAQRYIRWFGVRVLKVKSLFGQRQEIAATDLRDFE